MISAWGVDDGEVNKMIAPKIRRFRLNRLSRKVPTTHGASGSTYEAVPKEPSALKTAGLALGAGALAGGGAAGGVALSQRKPKGKP